MIPTSGPNALVVLALAGYAGLGIVAAFVRLERHGRVEVVVAIVLGALIAQCVFFSSDSSVPSGPLRPGPFRLGELLVMAAIAARLWTRWLPSRVTPTGLAWFAFLTWYGTALLIGRQSGHSNVDLGFHAKLLLHLGGGYVVAAGIPIRRLLAPAALTWGAVGLGSVAAVQVMLRATGQGHLFPSGPTHVGPDAASLYLGLAVIFLAVELTRDQPRLFVVAASVPALVAPLMVEQRASVVHLGAAAAVALFAISGGRAAGRFNVTPVHAALAGLAVVVLGVMAWVPNLKEGETAPPIVGEAIEDTFGGVGNQQSADARVLKWDEAEKLFQEHPIIGNGLGVNFQSFRPGINGVGIYAQSNVFDNAYVDLLVRTGIVGLFLFVLAIGFTIRDAWWLWRRHPDRTVAAAGLGLLLVVVGLVAKCGVESILDKVTLSTLLGMAAGVIATARATPAAAPGPEPSRTVGVEETGFVWS